MATIEILEQILSPKLHQNSTEFFFFEKQKKLENKRNALIFKL